ncbi:MAG: peptidoglycan-binding domain-containing protein [Oscillospiraceae bacterium]
MIDELVQKMQTIRTNRQGHQGCVWLPVREAQPQTRKSAAARQTTTSTALRPTGARGPERKPRCPRYHRGRTRLGAVGIYWHDKAAIVHTDTRGGKATWLCVQPGVYPSTTYNKFVLPTIEQGCEGAANRAATVMLQRLLGIPHDGSFGPATTKALMTAQRKHGLVPDGICGPKSWTALSGADKYL